ncbi:hypothetical protein LPJ66_000230 [Kickxella alabastrina]|uniref:Uncharacterized protein n=1 Tax=Kickxella alabastrina TaxID=61397 RepID=A0ACC1IWM3_9FUNG|nr:hypothetical protein LPJ66_000230 [Kickxella alabastrina]
MWASKRPGPPAGGHQKKLIIKGLRSVPTLPATYKADTLARLQSAVQAIQTSQSTAQGFEELYRDCESLCLHKFGSDIYAMLQGELDRHAQQQLQSINAQPVDSSTDTAVLEQIQKFWTAYIQQLGMIKCVFLYLDRTYVLQTANTASLWSMGLSAVRRFLIDTDMKSRLIRLIIGEITKERNGKAVDRAMLLSLVNMFVELGLYLPFFMPSFIEATHEYYQRESRRLVGSLVPTTVTPRAQTGSSSGPMDVPQYLVHVKRRLDEESQRASNYLGDGCKTSLLSTAQAELVEKHTDRLLSFSFDAMADAHMLADLANLFMLLDAVNRLDALKKHWASYIKKTGLRLVQAPELNVTLVTELLALKQRLDIILSKSFRNNASLMYTLSESFGEFINTRRNKPAQLVAKFIDQCLRSGSKISTDDDLDKLLDRVLVLFRFIQGKDIFEAYYKRDMAKRLLYNKSVSVDAERMMLQRLKTECGAGFTKQLEGMYRDMEISDDITAKFVDLQQAQPTEDIGFHAKVLTLASWPTYEPLGLVVPRQVEQAQDSFFQFYGSKHKGRNLQWQHGLGTCILTVNFDEGPKDLALTVVQGTVMLQFTQNDELTYTQIRNNTGLEDIELQRILQSLACGKHRVLTKEPKGRDIAITDKFVFNAQFKSPLVRIKISQILVKEDDKEDKDVEEHVQQDRMLNIDAALIRIMKARKTAEHSALMTDLVNQLKFSTSSAEVKERLDILIERDYMKRDESDQAVYHYVA